MASQVRARGAAFQLPLARRLSRLYSDTKKSTDFLQEPVRHEGDPHVRALHRKLRIQKDRLVSWGLDWSDSADIDDSLSDAGLSDVVASIMSTIQDTLAEAEPLWLTSKRRVESPRPALDRKPPLLHWDKARLEDLVHDLTVSIDTLYDLSRTRLAAAAARPRASSKSAFKAPPVADDTRLFQSSRMQTPRLIDPHDLVRPYPFDTSLRQVVFLSKAAYHDLGRGTSLLPGAPLLLEYAAFDPMYAATGIMPEMVRFARLSAALQEDPQRDPETWTGLPRILGYFEDLENSRLGIVYRLPFSLIQLSPQQVPYGPTLGIRTLRELISRPESEPPLEAKFKLAFNLANTVFDMNARGFGHGNLDDNNVTFRAEALVTHGIPRPSADVRRPLVSAFDLFGENTAVAEASSQRSSPHLDVTQSSPSPNAADERMLDLPSLAVLLLSVGLWTNLEALEPELASLSDSHQLLDRLAVRCGSLYVKAVRECWGAVDEETSGNIEIETEALLLAVQSRVSRCLEACSSLDGNNRQERPWLENSLQGALTAPQLAETADDENASARLGSADGGRKIAIASTEPAAARPLETVVPTEDRVAAAEAKIRLYPHVPLAPEAVENWNTVVMPQINQALRAFYRKHPESVEISLESVGPSPSKTQPTVLVVCTSVGKVRAILKKKLADIFNGTSAGFGLKVCKGHVLRSRKQASSSTPSSAYSASQGLLSGDGLPERREPSPVNIKHQHRPGNGASIGAWIGDRYSGPVSFGGLILVDDKPYGMTVHHMLDNPDQETASQDTTRSGALSKEPWSLKPAEAAKSDDDVMYDLSDTESEPYSDSDLTSDYDEDDDGEEGDFEIGDIPGVEPGCGEGYIVTQPAFDDVVEGFFPCPESEDEEHRDVFGVGEVFASSGIRRKEANGLVHEVDWALFSFSAQRLPDDNCIPRAVESSPQDGKPGEEAHPSFIRPTSVAPSSSLPGMEVQCVGRSSGVQTGHVLPALTSVKIYGRTSPSHTYQVTGSLSAVGNDSGHSMGMPGDSGAWVVDRINGQLCGHVLAWSERKRVAYICPMDVLLLDVAETLEATEVRLPGGEPVVTFGDLDDAAELEGTAGEHTGPQHPQAGCSRGSQDDAGQRADLATTALGTQETQPYSSPGLRARRHGPSSPLKLDTSSSQLQGFANKLEQLSISPCQGIGVS